MEKPQGKELPTARAADRFRRLARRDFDAVVIGAGLGGLTSAALLAKSGMRVLVVDQHYIVGGYASTFRRRAYEFDVGVHYVGLCHPGGPFDSILHASGAGDVAFRSLDSNGFDRLVFPDFEFRVPAGRKAFCSRLLATFPEEARGIARLEKMMQKVEHAISTIGQDPRLRIPLLLLRDLEFLLWADRPFSEYLDSCTSNPKLRAVLTGMHIDIGMSPATGSTLYFLACLAYYVTEGAFYPVGGGQVIADSLARSIEAAGGSILLRALVQRIHVKEGAVTGVRLQNKHLGVCDIQAPIVVSNGDYKALMAHLIEPGILRQKTIKKAAGSTDSAGGVCLYLGVKRNGNEPTAAANFHVQPHYDLEPEYQAIKAGRFVDDPSVFISVASWKDPDALRMRPAGIDNMVLFSIAPTSPEAWGLSSGSYAEHSGYEKFNSGSYSAHSGYSESTEYAKRKNAFAKRMLAVAARAIPDLEERIAFSEVSTPLTAHRYTLSSGGGMYGLAGSAGQSVARLDPKTEIKGLFLAGASSLMPGVYSSAISGAFAAEAILHKPLVKLSIADRARQLLAAKAF